ncbi:MAG TPA: hypothetical protein VE155_11750 [Pseudonocardiaceae bacterium]|nr:hypothetical protein [Pseudonocardiaceae bacterium]
MSGQSSLSGRIGQHSAGEVVARVMVAVGLGYDAYAHLDLAASFDGNRALLSQGMLFRVEAVAAILAALLVLVIRHRAVALLAVVIAGSALGAVVLYRYVDLGSLGPLPDMYEASWYPEKTYSAIAEATAILAGGALLALSRQMALTRLMPGEGHHR